MAKKMISCKMTSALCFNALLYFSLISTSFSLDITVSAKVYILFIADNAASIMLNAIGQPVPSPKLFKAQVP